MIYKHDLWNLPTKITFFFYLIYLLNVLFSYIILFYFAKPNFIIYDEWFDDNFKKNEDDFKNKNHYKYIYIWIFYEQANHKFGTSENNIQLNIKLNQKK